MNTMKKMNPRQEGETIDLFRYYISDYREDKRVLVDNALFLEECDRRIPGIQASIDEQRSSLPNMQERHMRVGIQDMAAQRSVEERREQTAKIGREMAEIRQADRNRNYFIYKMDKEIGEKEEEKIQYKSKLREKSHAPQTQQSYMDEVARLEEEIRQLEMQKANNMRAYEREMGAKKREVEASLKRLAEVVDGEKMMRESAGNFHKMLTRDAFGRREREETFDVINQRMMQLNPKPVSGLDKAMQKKYEKTENEKQKRGVQQRKLVVDDYPAPRREFARSFEFSIPEYNKMRDELIMFRESNFYNMICFANKLRRDGKFKKKTSSRLYTVIERILDGKGQMSLNQSLYVLEVFGVNMKERELADCRKVLESYWELAGLMRELHLNCDKLLRCNDISAFTNMIAEAESTWMG